MPTDTEPGLIQRLCPHWYTADPHAIYEDGIGFTIEDAEKCMVCGHLRWHIRVEDGSEPHPTRDIDVEEYLSDRNVTVKRVDTDAE